MKNLLPNIELENRVWGLDIMRAIAIMTVLISHSSEFILDGSTSLMYHSGVAGVEIFFVLSGFLIGGILIKVFQKEYSLKNIFNFWKRRWIRTIPNYYLALLVNAAFAFLFLDKNYLVYSTEYRSYFIFLQNSFNPEPGLYGIAWSLSIEEWFYLLFPICSFILFRFFKVKSLLNHALIFIVGIVILRAYYIGIHNGNFDWLVRQRMPLRLDSIIFGVIMAYIFKYYNQFVYEKRNILALLGLILVIIGSILLQNAVNLSFMQVPYLSQLFMLNFYDIGIMLMLPFLYFLPKPKAKFGVKFITWISLISYSLYLYHIIIIKILSQLNLTNTSIYFLLWPIWFIVASLAYQFFELPILRIREKITNKE